MGKRRRYERLTLRAQKLGESFMALPSGDSPTSRQQQRRHELRREDFAEPTSLPFGTVGKADLPLPPLPASERKAGCCTKSSTRCWTITLALLVAIGLIAGGIILWLLLKHRQSHPTHVSLRGAEPPNDQLTSALPLEQALFHNANATPLLEYKALHP